MLTRNMLTKIHENSVAKFGKMLSFCYHLETHYFMRVIHRHHMCCDILIGSKSLVLFGENVIILLSLLSITKKTRNMHVGAFF